MREREISREIKGKRLRETWEGGMEIIISYLFLEYFTQNRIEENINTKIFIFRKDI